MAFLHPYFIKRVCEIDALNYMLYKYQSTSVFVHALPRPVEAQTLNTGPAIIHRILQCGILRNPSLVSSTMNIP
ncbi:hypothetical protein LZ32DRAFT_269981 [Colletotrichum eremochloae]|nr:hypothetical protein LZ32DRAFT_269981 [Colletotrichum eremochloae]